MPGLGGACVDMIPPPWRRSTARANRSGSEVVENEVDRDAGEADVDPYRPQDARDAAVLGESLPPRQEQSAEHHGQDHDRQQHVAEEDSEVDRLAPAVPGIRVASCR